MGSENLPPGIIQRILDWHWARGELLDQREMDHIIRTGNYPWIDEGATSATSPQHSPQHLVYEAVPAEPDREHVKLAQAMFFIAKANGIRLPAILGSHWNCHRSTTSRFFRKWPRYIRKTTTATRVIEDGHARSKGFTAHLLTGDGLEMWRKLGEELSDYLPGKSLDPFGNGEAEPAATSQPATSLVDAATSGVAPTPVEHVADVAPTAEPVVQILDVERPSSAELADFLPGGGIVTIEKFCLAAQIADPPNVEIPGDWIFSNKVNSRGGGGIKAYEKTFGRGWRFQITMKGGGFHLLKIMVRKRLGTQVWALATETEATAREYLRDICSMLEMRVYEAQVARYGIGIPSVTMRHKLDESIPYGHYVIVTDQETGEIFTFDKSTNGKLGMADIEYDSMEAFNDAAMSGRRSLEADQRSRRLETSMVDIARELGLQREVLAQIAENQAIETGIIAKNQLRRTMEDLDG